VQGKPVKIVGCGRTDAGVHASDYYAHFDVDSPLRDNWLFIMNKLLPEDIVLYRVWEVGDRAHSRYDAVARTYDYRIHSRPDPLLAVTSSEYAIAGYDFTRMREALAVLTGPHDFRAFCLTPDRHNTTTCELYEASLHEEGEGRYRFRFVANRFLRGMIRILVFQLLRAGAGEIGPEDFAEALRNGERLGTGQARPEGLVLSGVRFTPAVSSPSRS
jgi:tRNA pseudouridine38-40 synthase